MAGEHDQAVEQELTPEQDAAADAEFEAAFNKARGDEPHAEGSTSPTTAPTEAPNTGTAPTEQQAAEAEAAAKAQADADTAAKAEAEAKAQAEAEAARTAPVNLTQAEVDALRATAARVDQLQEELKRAQDSNAGRFGSLKQTIEAVKAQAQNGQRPTVKQMKRLEAEFPELATLLKEDLEEAFGAAAPAPATEAGTGDPEPTAAPTPAPSQAPAPVDPFTDPRVQQTLRLKEMAVVDAVHPDWRDLKATPEFNEWRNSLPPAAQQLLATSWEAKVLNDAFADFKGWKQKRAEQAATASQRNKRLEHGTPATTGQPTGTNAVDDDTAFLQGFQKARGT